MNKYIGLNQHSWAAIVSHADYHNAEKRNVKLALNLVEKEKERLDDRMIGGE